MKLTERLGQGKGGTVQARTRFLEFATVSTVVATS